MKELNTLIIDDNQDLVDGLAMVLKDENYQVEMMASTIVLIV